MIRDILIYPDQRLRTVAKPVKEVDDKIRTLIDDMFDTMYDAPGIGLAATQINVHKRVLVIDLSEEQNDPRVFINPEYEVIGDEPEEMQEGCLSIPGFHETISRVPHIRVKALDRNGKPFEEELSGLMAVCLQHEVDHLDGKLFVDYLSTLKRNRIRKKLEKLQRKAS